MAGEFDKEKSVKEWFNQSDYDYDVAETLYKTGKYIYAVFLAHLAVEKALKALYIEEMGKEPPKTHDLAHLTISIELEADEEMREYYDIVNDLCITVRYPEELEVILTEFDEPKTRELLNRTEANIKWLKGNSKIL